MAQLYRQFCKEGVILCVGIYLVDIVARLLYYLETSVYKQVYESLDYFYEHSLFTEAAELLNSLPQNPITTRLKMDLKMKEYLSLFKGETK